MTIRRMKIIRWVAIVAGSLATIVLIGLGILYGITNQRMNRTYSVTPHTVSAPGDSATLARGMHVSQIHGCTDCHGQNLAGKLFLDAPMVATIYSTNLTRGKGGIGGQYSDDDWERAIRHGINPNGKPLLFMPAQEFFHLGDEDLAALIYYLKTLPPVDNELPENSVGPIGRVLYLQGSMPLVPAELTDHAADHPAAPEPGITVQYGKYLTVGCTGCHGADFSGGPIPGVPPEWPPAANLTPAGNLRNWTEQGFIQAMRTGVKPSGERFSEYMPYAVLKAMTDDELKAVWLFLTSLPEK